MTTFLTSNKILRRVNKLSVTVRYGSGSEDPTLWLTDQDLDPEPTHKPDPGIFVSDLQDDN
jgi:hypothetical protein